MSESGVTAVSSVIGVLTRNLRSRVAASHERELCRERLARIAHRWSRVDLDHIKGPRGQRELVLAAVQSFSARRTPLGMPSTSVRVDGAVAGSIDEHDPLDTGSSQPRMLRLVYSRSD